MAMNRVFFVLTIWMVTLAGPWAWATDPCEEAETFANNTLSHAKRLYHSDSMTDAKFYAQNLLSAAQDTLKAASLCQCDDAEAFAEETINYAKRALEANSLDEIRVEAENAMGSAEDALKAAVRCND